MKRENKIKSTVNDLNNIDSSIIISLQQEREGT